MKKTADMTENGLELLIKIIVTPLKGVSYQTREQSVSNFHPIQIQQLIREVSDRTPIGLQYADDFLRNSNFYNNRKADPHLEKAEE